MTNDAMERPATFCKKWLSTREYPSHCNAFVRAVRERDRQIWNAAIRAAAEQPELALIDEPHSCTPLTIRRRIVALLKPEPSAEADEAIVDALVTRSQAGLKEQRFLTRAELARIVKTVRDRIRNGAYVHMSPFEAFTETLLNALAEAAESEDE